MERMLKLNFMQAVLNAGPGMRTGIFFAGCLGPWGRARREVLADGSRDGHCVGCHARQHWPREGWEIPPDTLARFVLAIGRDVSLLGGEPLLQASELRKFLWTVKQTLHPPHIALWSGVYWEDLVASPSQALQDCLLMVDVVVDGPYRPGLDDGVLPWRGSRNPRAIDAVMSLAVGEIVLAEGWNEPAATITPDGNIIAPPALAAKWNGLGWRRPYAACGGDAASG